MSTLADSLFADFDDDSDGDGHGNGNGEENGQEEESERAEETAGARGSFDCNRLLEDARFKEELARIASMKDDDGDDDVMFDAVVNANAMCVKVDEEVARLHAWVTDKYAERFPELESHVPEMVTYMKVVKRIGNEVDVTKVECGDLLSSAQVMAVAMTGAKVRPWEEEWMLGKVLDTCGAAIELVRIKDEVLLPFVAKQMPKIAPNMTELLGADITAQLLTLAGGLEKLVQIPGGNVLLIGKGNKALHGFARVVGMRHFGVIHGCPLVQECLPEHQVKAMRTMGGRVSLAARLDFDKSAKDGSSGRAWAEEIQSKLKKWHAPAPGKTKRPLPAPITDAVKRRGGRRARRQKEIMGMTEIRKQANRMEFGVGSDEYGDSAMGNTFGLLGKEGSGQIRITTKEQKKMQVQLEKKRKGGGSLSQHVAQRRTLLNSLSGGLSIPGTSTNVSGAQTGGMTSSVAFTPVQGIELVNPAAAQKRVDEANRKFFGRTSFAKRQKHDTSTI